MDRTGPRDGLSFRLYDAVLPDRDTYLTVA
jgi:hypothetical protein